MVSICAERAIFDLPDILQEARGPKIPVRFGRVDVSEQTGCAKEGKLPGNVQVTVCSGRLSFTGCSTQSGNNMTWEY